MDNAGNPIRPPAAVSRGSRFGGVSGATAPPLSFPPNVSGAKASIAGDFAGNQYFAASVLWPSFAAWMTAIGGTFSRASSATYLDGGVVKTATANTPRFPTALDGTPFGLRLTGAGTNLAVQSNNFGLTATWAIANVAAISSGIGPDGVTSAWSLLSTATTGNHVLFQSIVGLSAGSITGYAFFKAGGYQYGVVGLVEGGGKRYCAVADLVAGTITATDTSTAPTGVSSGVIPLANGWSMVWATMATAAGSGYIQVGPSNVAVPSFNSGMPTFTADGTSNILVFGGQLTNTALLFDYIPTTTTTVTQAADSLSFPYTQTTFSALVGTNGLLVDGSGNQVVLSAASSGIIYYPDSTHFASNGGGVVPPIAVSNVSNSHKTMVAGNATNTWLTADGLVPNTVAAAIVASTPSSVLIGSFNGSILFAPGNYSQLAMWNGLVASTAEMRRLTAP